MDTRALGSTLLRAFAAERAITVATRVLTDAPMLAILAWDSSVTGIATAFIAITPISFLLCVSVVMASDAAHKKTGVDWTGLETLRELEHEVLEEKRWIYRILQWILRSPRLIFWVGSWFYLDPDYVTLLLRKKGEGYIHVFLRITLPSAVLGMVVWTATYWAAVKGFWLAAWALEWVL